ncbi:MAG: hypothetical protein A2784_04065 [Candidatus Chisholmbacteria bacterium RIFCSPHIGHO2_01_FULL_48_12]|uniref:Acyltransferase 3 domain-containing protein n=1 Tax=Candidatus Chisholmbacteria bacterium RIFCSPHIGHO2_01_FULL_48_12 TaxID=1797589 RepID=A0A1G1VNM8_9BACT|nr:MAG: hypothetical protein A2784_04065 [Candidatus Chisholmbacteria bacterium RIFCSPHIGHO2_01_FULL_48_12]
MPSYHLFSIDLLKGLAIIAVLLWHSVPLDIQQQTLFEFHVGQSIPIFLVLMGLNYGMSFARKKYHRGVIYPRQFLFKQLKRFGIPFLLAFAASLIVGYWRFLLTGMNRLRLNRYLLLGRLPSPGPGNYYISALIQFILIFPLLYKLYRTSPRLTVILIFALDLSFQILTSFYIPFASMTYFIFGYLSPVGLGLWLSTDRRLLSPRNKPLAVAGIVSLAYLIFNRLICPNLTCLYFPSWTTQNVFSSFYAGLLVMLGLRWLPRRPITRLKPLSFIGQASFHIFLIQIIYFSVNPFQVVILDVLINLSLGSLFYKVTNQA